MKHILITGANSFLGKSFERYAENWPDRYSVETISVTDDKWIKESFTGYDTVFHVAGLAHIDTGILTKKKKELYYKVNRDLAVNTAKKAKQDGVKQFIFMSSAVVYGNSSRIGKQKVISRNDIPSPQNIYADSKYQAEQQLLLLQSDSFNVVIIRSPMIYGKGCKGNYSTLHHLIKKIPIFPYIKNERSMLYIGNFVEFVRLMIDDEEHGIFWPQNKEYVNTSDMVKKICQVNGKKIIIIKGFTWLFKFLSFFIKYINRAFGNLAYDKEMSMYKKPYQLYSFDESIELTEKE